MTTADESLLNVISEQNKRIQELERLLEEQKRLRLQDSSQVEEKAAKIKEWVTNKLKELENQNKHLRDQNRKQKEVIETLSRKLANSISHPTSSSSSTKNGVSLISIGDKQSSPRRRQQESPLYDCVNLELDEPRNQDRKSKIGTNRQNGAAAAATEDTAVQPQPPPPPPHQCDRWELELYDLAERTFSALRRESTDDSRSDQAVSSRKSCNMKGDIISVIKPNFTTIDGDQVVDETDLNGNGPESLETKRSSRDHSSQSSVLGYDTYQPTHSLDTLKHRLEADNSNNIFSSPIRSRSGKDSILRTQSVRRNPAPEKLYDFIASDLVKRGHLIKHGALRRSNRWFVLKNFHLYAYKCETDETDKSSPSMALKLDPTFRLQVTSQSGDGYPFKLIYQDKSLVLSADSAQARDEWINILTVAINLSDVEASKLTKANAIHEGMLSIARHGHSKRCHAVLVSHVVFFLKSPIDPTPLCYLSVKGAKIREVMDNYDYDHEETIKQIDSDIQDCSLAIYPRYSVRLDPLYLTAGSQMDTDEWFFHLSRASGVDQTCGTEFERTLTKGMLEGSIAQCAQHAVMISVDKPISRPLTTLPNETLRVEALELFKSVLLFAQVPIEPIAIDYHICLLQNCLKQFLKNPELRNEFFAQLIKQSNVGLNEEEAATNDYQDETAHKSVNCETLQVLQMLAIAVSLNLPRGRLRWWLTYRLKEMADTETNMGKYALFALGAMERTSANGGRDTVPSKTEIMGILLRNPYDHSKPHSLPVSFADGSHLVVGADGSTTVEEFMNTIGGIMNIRPSSQSDFYLFADDPGDATDLHILEPQRKVLDVVGWWEQQSKQNNSGRHHNAKAIKLICRKRLVLQVEEGETERERLLIVYQVHQEIISRKIPLSDVLIDELSAIMSQLNHGDLRKTSTPDPSRQKLAGRTAQDCIRIYLNCARRLNVY